MKIKKLISGLICGATIVTYSSGIFAEHGDVINTTTKTIYKLSTQDSKEIDRLINDVLSNLTHKFLVENESGRFYDPQDKQEAKEIAIIKLLNEKKVDLKNENSRKEFFKNKNNLILLKQSTDKAEKTVPTIEVDLSEYDKDVTDDFEVIDIS